MAFPPNAECGSVTAAGLARFDVNAAHIFMCLEPADICNGPTCDQFQQRARASLLHELGHVWEFQNVDAETRRSFLAMRDLDVWSDSESGWAPEGEGIEHAAEILSWGLMDEPMELIRIPDTGEAELTAAFQLLTGRAPLHS